MSDWRASPGNAMACAATWPCWSCPTCSNARGASGLTSPGAQETHLSMWCTVPEEPIDQRLEQFYNRLLTVLHQLVVRDGQWQLLECVPAWEGNWTWDCFLAFAWQGTDGDRLLVTVHYGAPYPQLIDIGGETTHGIPHVSKRCRDAPGAGGLLARARRAALPAAASIASVRRCAGACAPTRHHYPAARLAAPLGPLGAGRTGAGRERGRPLPAGRGSACPLSGGAAAVNRGRAGGAPARHSQGQPGSTGSGCRKQTSRPKVQWSTAHCRMYSSVMRASDRSE
jgi:hypothetical protein